MDDLAINNIITITDNTQVLINAELIESTSRFVLDSTQGQRARLQITASSPLFAYEYIGPSGVTFVSGSVGDVIIEDVGLVDRVGIQLLNIDSGLARFGKGTVRLWSDYGVVARGDFEVDQTRFAGWGAGFKLNDLRASIILNPRTISDPVGGILFDFFNVLADNRTVEITGVSGTMNPTTALCGS